MLIKRSLHKKAQVFKKKNIQRLPGLGLSLKSTKLKKKFTFI